MFSDTDGTMLIVHFIKSRLQSSLPWFLFKKKHTHIKTELQKQNKKQQKQQQKRKTNKQKKPTLWQHTEFNLNRLQNFWDNGHWRFDFSYKCDLEWWSKSSKLISNVELIGPNHQTKFERNQSVNVWMQAPVDFLYIRNRISRVLSLEHWMDGIKWA